MSLKGWSLASCLAGWICLALSLVLTRFWETDSWQVVVPLTIHLFAYLVLAWGGALSGLWILWQGRWQEEMAVACLNLGFCWVPVGVLWWNYLHQHKNFTKFALSLMWTGN